jgi:hypothetical protein
MDKLSAKTVGGIAVAAILLVTVAGWFFVISPPRSRAADLDVRITDARTELVRAKIAAEASKPDEELLAEYRRLTIAMPDQVQLSAAMRQLLKAAKVSKVRVDSIQTSPLMTVGGAQALPIDLVLTGKFGGVNRFLTNVRLLVATNGDKVEATGRLFSVSALEFAPGEDDLPQLTATVKLNAFVYTPTAATPPPTAETTTSTTASAAGRTS